MCLGSLGSCIMWYHVVRFLVVWPLPYHAISVSCSISSLTKSWAVPLVRYLPLGMDDLYKRSYKRFRPTLSRRQATAACWCLTVAAVDPKRCRWTSSLFWNHAMVMRLGLPREDRVQEPKGGFRSPNIKGPGDSCCNFPVEIVVYRLGHPPPRKQASDEWITRLFR